MRRAPRLLGMIACLCMAPGLHARSAPDLASPALLTFGVLHQDIPVLKAPDLDGQVSPFVRRIFQDRRGHLWFGTNGEGVARYDGKSLEYFSIDEGFGGEVRQACASDERIMVRDAYVPDDLAAQYFAASLKEKV